MKAVMSFLRANLPRFVRIRALRIRVLFACLVIVALCVGVAIALVGHELRVAYASAGRAQADALSSGFRLQEVELDGAGLGARLETLRRQAPGVVRVDVFVLRSGTAVKVASTDLSTLGDSADALDVAPLRDGRMRFREVRQHERHLLQTSFVLQERGHRFATASLYFDLRALDRALARSRRAAGLGGLGAGLLMALSLMAVLRWGVFRPLDRLRSVTWRLAHGELDARLRWRRIDEFGAMAADFDAMADALQHSHQRLEGLALTDPLTGLSNHRAFHEALAAELQRSRREVYDIALVALDIDRFKTINDTWGHAVGDEALRLVAQALRMQTRPGDLVARLGGDEFALALIRADADMAATVVERARAAIAQLGVGPDRAKITLSAGIAEFPAHADDELELIAAADCGLYAAKRAGRDRIVPWHPGGAEGGGEAPAAADDQAALLRTVHALALAVDAKDAYTHRHSHRVATYAVALAARLGFAEQRLSRLHTAGVLHDVGKIGVPDRILLKSGPLTPDEFAEMQRHSKLGADIIAGAGLDDVACWVRHLHERWDGSGYPDAIGGPEIPLESRILAVADAFEAMTSSRVYRDARSTETALEELDRCAATQFDPELAQAFIALVRSGGIRLETPADPGTVPAPLDQ
jgi:diguanylate cyclase (GGDEF)-like protein